MNNILISMQFFPMLLTNLDPWDVLNTDIFPQEQYNSVISLFFILQRVGLYGCIVTAVVFLMMRAFRWGDPRLTSEYKEKVTWKFILAFFISGATFFMGFIFNVLQSAFA